MKNRQLIKKMKDRGWGCEITKSNHLRFTHIASREFIICAGSASDYRSTKNMLATAKRIEEGRASARPQRQGIQT